LRAAVPNSHGVFKVVVVSDRALLVVSDRPAQGPRTTGIRYQWSGTDTWYL